MSDFLDVNPKTDCSMLTDETEVSFVPMPNVQEKNNVVEYNLVPYSKVKKGFTVFQKGDMIWAKITPCMQNGKSCIVDEMPTEVGFGSTEFHVVRKRTNDVYMPFIWSIFSNENVLKAAQAVFSGSAGQQRVSSSFIENFPCVIPNYDMQVTLASALERKLLEMNNKKQQALTLLNEFEENISNAFGLQGVDKGGLCYAIHLSNLDGVIDAKRYASVCNTAHKFVMADVVDVVEEKVNVTRYENQVIDWIRIDDLPNHPLDIAEVRTQPANEVEGTFFEIQERDILVARLGPTILNQKIVMVHHLERTTIASAEFLVLRVKEGFDPEAVMAILKTAYANALDYCGRKIAAIEQYKKVLSFHSNFGMALGNLGRVYQHYGMLEYDDSHRELFDYFAYQYLNKAINCNDPNTHDTAKKCFESTKEVYSPEYVKNVLTAPLSFNQYVYNNPAELTYREWCLKNVLFLNTLNDLPVSELCFAGDIIQLPNMIVGIHDKPIFHGMFSQLKQEYIYARYTYYSTLNSAAEPHFADKETYIIAHTDYAQYSIRLEKLKTAFKTLYGMFDKIAFFLEHYFDLGIKERDINFRSIWQDSTGFGKKRYHYKHTLDPNQNFALSSLYWISKDFFEKFEDSPNPELKRIKDIRDSLEHKYVKINDAFFEDRIEKYGDGLALYVSDEELYDVTLRLLKILREAIINLSLCVNIAESPKREATKDKFIIPINLMDYEDDWKI